jgi:autotransporter-associated beta strand protein
MSDWLSTSGGEWTNPSLWTAGIPNASGATANFALTGFSGTTIVGIHDLAVIRLGSLNVSQNLTIKGSIADTGTGNGLIIFDGGNSNANVNVTNGSAAVFEFSSADGLRLQLDSNTDFNISHVAGLVRLNAPIQGTGMLIKSGVGTIEINGANSFSGGIGITGGILIAPNNASLGSGTVTISNDSILRSSGIVDNGIATINGASGDAGSARIETATSLTLAGTLAHLSQGTLMFGSLSTAGGTIIASFSDVLDNPVSSGYFIASGTLRMGNAYSAANLFSRPGNGITETRSGVIIDTNGFSTVISNLHIDGGGILSSTGALDVTVNSVFTRSTPLIGQIYGTVGVDRFLVNASGNYDLALVGFIDWINGVDQIAINGSSNDNLLGGSTKADTIFGFDGNDVITGNGGVDALDGGNGNDRIVINGNNDGSTIDGGVGIDRLALTDGAATLGSIAGIERVELSNNATLILAGAQFSAGLDLFSSLGGNGTIQVDMAAGGGQVIARGMSVDAGSNIVFVVNGGTGNDLIKAALGATNQINAGDGNDNIVGGNLSDTLNGGNGIDKIAGNGGGDIMTGGGGADVFKFKRASDTGIGSDADIITDFGIGTDKLNFRNIDTDPSTPGVQGFAYIGTAAFSASGAAQIRYTDSGTYLRVDCDVNGDGATDMQVILLGLAGQSLTAADFVL